MKRRPMRPIDVVNHKLAREYSQGSASMDGIPWCYVQAYQGSLVDKHPVKQLTKGKRRSK